MKKRYLSQIEEGTLIHMDLYNEKGVVLVKKNTKMTTELKKKLLKNNINFLIENMECDEFNNLGEDFEDSAAKEIIEIQKVYQETFEGLRREIDLYKSGKPIDKKIMYDIAKELVLNISEKQQVYVSIKGIRKKDFYTYIHSIDVSIFMIFFGKSLNFTKKELEEAALAGILHDIGKLKIRDSILLKPDKLTGEEMEEIKKHTVYGYDILKNELGCEENIARTSKEHHEKLDGSGYPRGVFEQEIHLLSKMAAICDIYDAITADRAYKKAMLPHKAVEYLMSIADSHVDYELLRKFILNIAIYPLGTKVLLNTDEQGIIIKLHKGFPLRPIVKIMGSNKTRDLFAERTVFIKEVIQ